MPAAQQLLFPDPQPLVERLGRDFFRQLPEGPGIYLMRDASDVILYVGKAKNLRKRLCSYRVANPDRMLRRHLRLLHAVARIELQECPDESSALARESELLRTVRPKFNRAGTWRPPPRFFAWRCLEQQLFLAVRRGRDELAMAWSVGRRRAVLRVVLVSSFGGSSATRFSRAPLGWFHGRPSRDRHSMWTHDRVGSLFEKPLRSDGRIPIGFALKCPAASIHRELVWKQIQTAG